MNARDVEDIYELSPLQQGMLFHTLYEPAPRLYLEQVVIPFDGGVNRQAFEDAWNWLAGVHPALRTSFHWEEIDKPVQIVHRSARVPLDVHDLRGADADAEVARLVQADRARGFDMGKAPLLRTALFQTGPASHRFLLSFHHAILDGWSLQLVVRQFSEAYGAFCAGQVPPRPAAAAYGEYIRWLKQQDSAAAASYWKRVLAGYDGGGKLLGDVEDGAAESFGECEIALDAGTQARLKELAARHKLTMNTLVQGAWALLLQRFGGSDDVVFGIIASGRPAELAGVENIVGLFINTVPLRARVDRDARLIAWLQTLQAEQFAARQFDHTPLVQVQDLAGFSARRPLFDTLFAFENYPVGAGGDGTAPKVTFVERTNYPLTAVVVPFPRELRVRLLFSTAVFSAAMVRGIAEQYALILESLGDVRIDELPALTARERALFDAVNETRTDYPASATIVTLFRERAAAAPERIAVDCGDRTMTYAQLDAESDAVAAALQARGVRSGTPVALLFRRGIENVVAMLAVLKAGGMYVPIDPAYPAARIAAILRDTGAQLVLDATPLPRAEENVRPVATTADDAACIYYTSGSTGRPKGIVVPHRAIVRLVRNTNYVHVRPDDGIGHVSNPAFDAASFEVWGALINGARVVGIGEQTVLSPTAFAQALQERSVSLMFLTAALFNQIVAEVPDAFRPLRLLLVGGDAVDPATMRVALETTPSTAFGNGYGPTESATFALSHRIAEVPPGAATVPIGLPIANTTMHVLDDALHPVPPGGIGELYLGGDGLAHGYHRQPALTAERFLPDPFSPAAGARMYRTGDRVRCRPDGVVEFLGRYDDQVKLRGFRIELPEIERCIADSPFARHAAVVLRNDPAGGKRIVAYVVPRADAPPRWQEALRQSLRAQLPAYMEPAAIESLAALPLNENGKLDRAALPEPRDGRGERDEAFVAPRTATERKLASIWQELLGLERVGVDDAFLAVGGHSLRATQLVSRIRRAFNVELPLRAVFEAATIAEQAALLESREAALPPGDGPRIAPIPRDKHRVVT